MPFYLFLGINVSLFSKAKPLLAKAEKGIYIYNIEEHTLTINSNYKNNAMIKDTSSYIKGKFPGIPKDLKDLLLEELKKIKKNLDSQIYDKRIANLGMKNLFIHIFIQLMQDYKRYSYVIEDYPIFNTSLMAESKKDKNDRIFYENFCLSQLFEYFIQKSLLDHKEHISKCA